MNERILKIEEVTDFQFEGSDMYEYFDGFWITTDRQVIKIGIRNNQCCCEDWGYFISEDEIKKFIGAKLLKITETNINLITEEIRALRNSDCETLFINFETNKGTLQFVAYNAHNGYYGHEAILSSEQLNIKEML